MNSSLSPPSSFSPAAVKSKRQSLSIRPLHLVDGNVQSSIEISTPSSSKEFPDFDPKPRRQSSISYHPRDRELAPRSPVPRLSLSRRNSLGLKLTPPRTEEALQDRPPLTLAEKQVQHNVLFLSFFTNPMTDIPNSYTTLLRKSRNA